MRLRKYLQEKDVVELSNEVSDFNDMIQKDCKEYLKLIKGKEPLFRGMSGENNFGTKSVRKNRRSLGMDKETFKKFNKWLKKNGHNRRDESMSVTSNPGIAESFGEPFFVFPIGKLSYSWVMAKDINIIDQDTGWAIGAVDAFMHDKQDLTKKGFKNYFFTDRGFDKAYKNNWELWINCDAYHYASARKLKGFAKWDENEQRFKM